ncbi:MAG: phospholipase A [Steroidobacteraceae bacterium]
MRYRVSLGILFAALAPLAHADYILSTRTPYIAAGESLELTLLITNPDAAPLSVDVPAEIHMRMDTGPSAAIVEFVPESGGTVIVAPNGFRQVVLKGTVPTGSIGTATLSTTGFASNPLMIVVSSPSPPVAPVVQMSPATELVDKPPPLAVTVYDPVYFLVGGNGGLNAKFQISLRYRLFDGKGAFARRLPWLDDLYFSYTQTSLWNVDDLSKPFRDSSYRPRLFYSNYDLIRVADGRVRLGIEGGLGHESNGKDGLDSRSIHLAYARPTLTFGDPEGKRFYVAPMIYQYLEKEENPDIADYRGRVDLLVGYGRKSGLDFWGTFRKGEVGSRGSMELNVSYPLSRLSGGDLTGWLMAQYFNGYGESLVDYNHKLDAQFRFGLAIAL